MKRILTIQDISCFGKCLLTAALPVLSAMGIETTVLPTALLSTHTLFTGCTRMDLSDQQMPIAEHRKREGIGFDAIFTGYLGTEEEIGTVLGSSKPSGRKTPCDSVSARNHIMAFRANGRIARPRPNESRERTGFHSKAKRRRSGLRPLQSYAFGIIIGLSKNRRDERK